MVLARSFIQPSGSHIIMLSRLKSVFTRPINPSALLVIGKFGSFIHILHVLPEENNIHERFGLATRSSTTAFYHYGATEQTRERIGTVTLHVGDGETADSFLDDVETRVRKLQNDSSSSSPAQEQMGTTGVIHLVEDVLKPAATDAIHERETRERCMNATQAYPVYILFIKRSRAGKILQEPTSLPS